MKGRLVLVASTEVGIWILNIPTNSVQNIVGTSNSYGYCDNVKLLRIVDSVSK